MRRSLRLSSSHSIWKAAMNSSSIYCEAPSTSVNETFSPTRGYTKGAIEKSREDGRTEKRRI